MEQYPSDRDMQWRSISDMSCDGGKYADGSLSENYFAGGSYCIMDIRGGIFCKDFLFINPWIFLEFYSIIAYNRHHGREF